jgi:PhoPQ-activated pathogenicity-related protein
MSGASKRGWTTWLAAGIDRRVEAFIPIVMPILNIVPNLNSAFRSLGGWTWTFADYVSVSAHLNLKFLILNQAVESNNISVVPQW